MGGKQTQTQTTGPDAATQAFVSGGRNNVNSLWDLLQPGLQGGISPQLQTVLDSLNQQAGVARSANAAQTADYATKAHAFGGSRQSVLQALGNRNIDQGLLNTTGQLTYQDQQQQIQNALAVLGQMQGFGAPQGGRVETQTKSGGGLLQTALGLAGTVGGFALGGPGGAALGGKLAGSIAPTGEYGQGGDAGPQQDYSGYQWWK